MISQDISKYLTIKRLYSASLIYLIDRGYDSIPMPGNWISNNSNCNASNSTSNPLTAIPIPTAVGAGLPLRSSLLRAVRSPETSGNLEP